MLSRSITRLSASPPGAPQHHHDVERRRALRVDLPFPATVRGTDSTGERFTSATQIDNLSACGVYLKVRRSVSPGTKLFVVIRLCATADSHAPAPYVAVQGIVHRAEAQADGRCAVAVEFDRHRFLYAPEARNDV